MARKPVSELSPAYARRLARGEAQGKTRQEARGHRAGEHIVRKAGGASHLTEAQRRDAERLAKAVKGKRGKARAEIIRREAALARRRAKRAEKFAEKYPTGNLTPKDIRYARMIGKRWSGKLSEVTDDQIEVAQELAVRRMERMSAAGFRRAVELNREAYRQYRDEIDEGSYGSRGFELLEQWAAEDEEPIAMWYYYHSYS